MIIQREIYKDIEPYLDSKEAIVVTGRIDDDNKLVVDLENTLQQKYFDGGADIDFILNKKQAYEVKLSPSAKDLNTLKRLSQELECPETLAAFKMPVMALICSSD